MDVKIKKLIPEAVIPFYATDGSAGMDITATAVEFDWENRCWKYHTGLAFELPEGYVMLGFPRSSNRKTDVYIPNHIPVLDSDYRGELMIMFKNRDAVNDGEQAPYKVGERICQIIIMPYPKINFVEVEELNTTKRGSGGFGSTGTV